MNVNRRVRYISRMFMERPGSYLLAFTIIVADLRFVTISHFKCEIVIKIIAAESQHQPKSIFEWCLTLTSCQIKQ